MSDEKKSYSKKVLGIVGSIVAAGGITTGVLMSGDEPGPPIDPPGLEIQKPLERDIADRHIVHNGKKIRIVGGKLKEGAEPEDNELGRTVEATIDENIGCNVLLEGEPIELKDFTSEDSNFIVPKLLDLKEHITHGSAPVLLGCATKKRCFWTWFTIGDTCIKAAESSGYLASSIEEILKLDIPAKRVLLQVEGECDINGKTHPCYVPFGDKRAKEDGIMLVPHNWGSSGRKINFAKAKNGKSIRRYKDEDFRKE